MLPVAFCNVTSFRVSCVRILLRSCGSEEYDSRDRSLWLFASFCVIDVHLRHRHEPHDIAVCMTSLCSLNSTLICAVLHPSLESSPAGCTREYALAESCAVSTCCARISIAVAVLSPPPRVRVKIFALLCFVCSLMSLCGSLPLRRRLLGTSNITVWYIAHMCYCVIDGSR